MVKTLGELTGTDVPAIDLIREWVSNQLLKSCDHNEEATRVKWNRILDAKSLNWDQVFLKQRTPAK